DRGYSALSPGYLSFSPGALIEVTENPPGRFWGKLDEHVQGWIAPKVLNTCLYSADFLDEEFSVESQESAENVSNTSTLVFNGSKLAFPQNDKSDFLQLRVDPEFAYFDRTGYISVLSSFEENVLLFLRPRRFGKSLTLSMLAYFHGVEHRKHYDNLFKGLAIDQYVQAGTVIPYQYLVLSLDFSAFNRDPDPKIAKAGLFNMINRAIGKFYTTYANNAIDSLNRCVNVVQFALRTAEGVINHQLTGVKGIYLLADEYDASANEYLNLNNTTSYDNIHKGQSSLKDFWACVKSSMGYQRIIKCFITGVLPLSLDGATSGFNIATNVSDEEELAGFCGLSYGDVRSALKAFCKNGDVEKHFRIMVQHYNGYSFSPYTAAQRVFNTNTCLEYLQTLLMNEPINPSNPSNWETSETLLQMLACSPIATDILEKVGGRNSAFDSDLWHNPIKYDTLPLQFRFSDLKKDATRNKEAWLSFMRYAGGLTYAKEEPGKQLQIPNLVQVQRFAMAVLDRYQLRVMDIEEGLRKIATTGDISQLLGCYERLMSQRDVDYSDFDKNEEHHRDSIYYTLLRNPLLQGHVNGDNGQIDLVIEIPSTSNTIIIEFKVIKIDFLNIAGADRLRKASTLEGYSSADDVLQILFGSWDIIRAGNSIIRWITLPGGPAAQLASYWNGPQVADMRSQGHVSAFLVVIVGSRKVLFSRLNDNGQLENFNFACPISG
ncbi:11156_t:CDS:2, partial [Paraglomus occultum]